MKLLTQQRYQLEQDMQGRNTKLTFLVKGTHERGLGKR